MEAAKNVIAQVQLSPKYTDDASNERKLRKCISDSIGAVYDLHNKKNDWIRKIKIYELSNQYTEEKYYRFYVSVLRFDPTKKIDATTISTIESLLLNRLSDGELHRLWGGENKEL
jgi:hypothetical protein